MESAALAQRTLSLDSSTRRVLAQLQRPGKGDAAFSKGQLHELQANSRIKVDSFDSGYSYISAVNHIFQGRPGIGHKSGTKSLSLMVWDLLQNDQLKGERQLKKVAKMLHRRTGAHQREANVSNPICDWIENNSDVLSEAVEFVTPKAELAGLGASSKKKIEVNYGCCGSTSITSCDRFTEKVKSHKKYGTPVKCADCAKSFIPLRAVFDEYIQILENSGITTDRVTAAQLELPSGTTEEIELFFGCHGGYVTLSAESLKNKLKLAAKKSHARIACNDCSIAQGKIEGRIISFIRGNIATAQFLGVPAAEIHTQFRIPSIISMPFDMLVIAADGTRTIIEVDGGFHYENPDAESFLQRVANDKLKTETALREGYKLIRIDERKLIIPTGEIEAMLLKATIGDVKKYTVMGDECPGAAQADRKLKGSK